MSACIPMRLAVVFAAGCAGVAWCGEVSPAGRRLAAALDAMEVERLWLPGRYVNWETGEPLDRPVTDGKPHTHCSQFVAAACMRLGVYILRPPEHSAGDLANGQHDWLPDAGQRQGWRTVADGFEAQRLASEGWLVVAVVKEESRNGHIAIVRPGNKEEEALRREGPDVIQAGGHNARCVSAKKGFGNHTAAWRERRLRYFAHEVEERR